MIGEVQKIGLRDPAKLFHASKGRPEVLAFEGTLGECIDAMRGAGVAWSMTKKGRRAKGRGFEARLYYSDGKMAGVLTIEPEIPEKTA